jgi:5-methylcytosine-specific restriction endonuclease McrA
MIKKREGHKIIILEPAQTRILNDQCPVCALPKCEWTRRKDWRCCSEKCTIEFGKYLIIYGWPDLRHKAFQRDNFTCIQCGYSPKIKRFDHEEYARSNHMKYVETTDPDESQLVGDHKLPIALGGEEWDINNIQTLCKECNKVKTRADQGKIAIQRRKDKMISKGQVHLL